MKIKIINNISNTDEIQHTTVPSRKFDDAKSRKMLTFIYIYELTGISSEKGKYSPKVFSKLLLSSCI